MDVNIPKEETSLAASDAIFSGILINIIYSFRMLKIQENAMTEHNIKRLYISKKETDRMVHVLHK